MKQKRVKFISNSAVLQRFHVSEHHFVTLLQLFGGFLLRVQVFFNIG